MVFLYNIHNGALTKLVSDKQVKDIVELDGELFMVVDGKISVFKEPDDEDVVNYEISTGKFNLEGKFITTDAFLNRLKPKEVEMTITNEQDTEVNYKFDEHVFKINLAKGVNYRFMQIALKGKTPTKIIELVINMDKVATP